MRATPCRSVNLHSRVRLQQRFHLGGFWPRRNITSQMNKFERRGSADHDTLSDEIAGELSHITTEVLDVSDAPSLAPPAPLSQDEVRTILISLMLTMFLA